METAPAFVESIPAGRTAVAKLTGGRSAHPYILAALLLFYLVIATASSLTKVPICDEGWYADPARNLAAGGDMGSPVIESAGRFLKGIDRYTYWIMPLHIVVQAGWYKVFGASLFTLRFLSVFAGLIALICWYVTILKLGHDKGIALLTLLLVEVDPIFLALAATGRSDMLSVAFGSAAQASYLLLRGRHFKTAILIAHGLVAASGLTHPVGGLVALGTLLFLQVYLDRGRLRLAWVLPMAAPYIAGGIGWGMYILKSPDLFRSQFGGNSAERLWPWKSPLLALRREIAERFFDGYRIGSAWSSIANVRLLILVACLVAIFTILFHRDLRRTHLVIITRAQIAFTFLILAFFEGAKQPWYLIHIVLPFAAAVAISLHWYWRCIPSRRPLLVMIALGFTCIELGYPVLSILQNKYEHSYSPAVAVLSGRATEPRSVMGSAELGFGLGFDKVLDDYQFGYFSGKEPRFIVFDPVYRSYLDRFRQERPAVYNHIQALLTRRYKQVYSNGYYVVWARQYNGKFIVPRRTSTQPAARVRTLSGGVGR